LRVFRGQGGFGKSLKLRTDSEFTRILSWPGYRVYRHAIDAKRLDRDLGRVLSEKGQAP
jgi:hypothetical protein